MAHDKIEALNLTHKHSQSSCCVSSLATHTEDKGDALSVPGTRKGPAKSPSVTDRTPTSGDGHGTGQDRGRGLASEDMWGRA